MANKYKKMKVLEVPMVLFSNHYKRAHKIYL